MKYFFRKAAPLPPSRLELRKRKICSVRTCVYVSVYIKALYASPRPHASLLSTDSIDRSINVSSYLFVYSKWLSACVPMCI
jgi:hypothetical protein